MVIDDAPGPGPDPLDSGRVQFWRRGKDDWDEAEPPTSAIFTVPGIPWRWRVEPTGAIDAAGLEHWVAERLRLRGVAGSEAALRFLARSVAQANRGTGVPATRPGDPTLPPQVAAAMIEAGLVALGAPFESDVPPPVAKGSIDSNQEP